MHHEAVVLSSTCFSSLHFSRFLSVPPWPTRAPQRRKLLWQLFDLHLQAWRELAQLRHGRLAVQLRLTRGPEVLATRGSPAAASKVMQSPAPPAPQHAALQTSSAMHARLAVCADAHHRTARGIRRGLAASTQISTLLCKPASSF
jgi:hypothetical protein